MDSTTRVSRLDSTGEGGSTGTLNRTVGTARLAGTGCSRKNGKAMQVLNAVPA